MDRFSTRYNLRPPSPEITIRHEAPIELRHVIADIACECGLRPGTQRDIICRVLRVRADPDNWSDFPNVDGEVRDHLEACAWYQVYDLVEEFRAAIALQDTEAFASDRQAPKFDQELNDYFVNRGIGWKIKDGLLEVRGPEAFEHAINDAMGSLKLSGRQTARGELHEALRDLSRRPSADLTGAMQHGMAALECVARDATGESTATLGQLLSRHKGIVPRPLDTALEKLWGFASERGRHLREGGEPGRAEVELVVHVAAAVVGFLDQTLPPLPPAAPTAPPIVVDDDEIPF